MTDIHLLSDAELNEAIAVKRGWEHYPSLGVSWYKWILRDANGNMRIGLHRVPSFTTDPRYAMELLKEMPFQTTLHNYENELDGTKMHWGCTVANLVKPSETIQALADTPERAIAEAYAKWRAG